MTFIITFIALIIERFFHWSYLRQWRWFAKYQRWLLGTRVASWPSIGLLILTILPPLLLVGLLSHLLCGCCYGILYAIFALLVLVYCMGPYNLWAQTFSCLTELHKEDPQLVIDRAQHCFGIEAQNNSQLFHRALTSAIFVEANRRIFAVIFWFALLGPVGAVLYRSISLSIVDPNAPRIQRILDWLPARLFALLFALSGNFNTVIACWKKEVKTKPDANEKVLAECGIAALNITVDNGLPEDGAAEKTALELVDRTFIIALIILAAVVLIV